ncbi:HelD family protein [Georgenia sp. MJ170]|uniref:HelD family protein n=1 Tax=Georgenia sunbinii TaxID=3117728 RepID=UPI002F267E3B
MQSSSDIAGARPGAVWAADQEFVDAAYLRLDELRGRYRDRLAEVRREGPSGSPQNRSERDAFATHYEDTLARLDQVENRLVFGRLDLTDGTSRYIGRIGIADEDQESLLIDWRAPAAQPFYQATAVQRGDVLRRRHLVTRGRVVTGVEDELLDADADLDGLTGEGALFAAMAAKREGRMGDIVATIQAEQDRVIRSDLGGILVVEGGPGTGKTAVALHRAAYLLYTHRARLERSGVLIVGPSPVFLRYIEQVLPSLGESGVVAATMPELLGGVTVDGTEPEEVAAIKGRVAMAEVLRRAVRAIPRRLAEPRVLDVDGEKLTLEPQDVQAAQDRARRTTRPHNVARKTYATAVLKTLVRRWSELKGLDLDSEYDYLLQSLRESRDARREINLGWMPTTPEQLLRRIYADPALLARHGRGLDDRQRGLLYRPVDAPWTTADLPLLDELAVLLGTLESADAERTRRAQAAERTAAEAYAEHAISEDGIGGGIVDAATLAARFAAPAPRASLAERAAADREWTYGHIVVDEAQELSPMAWRALLRRNPSRSMTLVGDLDQRSGHRPVTSWTGLLGTAARDQVRTEALTINYRTPATVMAAAVRTLRAAGGAHAAPASSARDVPDALQVTPLPADGTEVALADVVAAELAALDGGRLAVVTADRDVAAVRRTLQPRLGEALTAPGGDFLAAPVVVLDAVASKGLEFDVVVLVEPARVLEGGPGDLYVAMTRPTTRLHVVHQEPLPAGITE